MAYHLGSTAEKGHSRDLQVSKDDTVESYVLSYHSLRLYDGKGFSGLEEQDLKLVTVIFTSVGLWVSGSHGLGDVPLDATFT